MLLKETDEESWFNTCFSASPVSERTTPAIVSNEATASRNGTAIKLPELEGLGAMRNLSRPISRKGRRETDICPTESRRAVIVHTICVVEMPIYQGNVVSSSWCHSHMSSMNGTLTAETSRLRQGPFGALPNSAFGRRHPTSVVWL